MLLSDEELRRSPEVVLRRVIEFIGLKVTDDFVTSVRDRDIGGVVMEAFPSIQPPILIFLFDAILCAYRV